MATDLKYTHLAAHDALLKAKRLLLVSHPKPDGDTLGAATAMLNYCREKGIAVRGFCKDKVPDQYGYMVGTEHFTHEPAVFGEHVPDVIAVFDAGDLRHAGIDLHVEALAERPLIINFDHHATNVRFGDINVLDIGASSTAEVVYDFLGHAGADISRNIATCILTGILTDTGNFSNPATTQSCLEAASILLHKGAKLQDVANRLVRNKSLPALQMWGKALSRLKYDPASGLASTMVFKADMLELGEDFAEGISNFINQFLDVKIVLVLRELPDGKIKGSYRTISETDVSAMAKVHGGGGHKKAAGFTVVAKVAETETEWQVVT